MNLIFSKKGFGVPQELDDFKVPNALSKTITLDNHREILLTDSAMSAVEEIAAILYEADPFGGLAGYGDIWNACRQVIKDLISKRHRPDDGAEYVSLATEIVRGAICVHTFVVALFGIDLEDVDELALGSLKVVRPSRAYIDSLGLNHSGDSAERFVEHTKGYLWLTGSVRGTYNVSKQKFREIAQLATGMLAIVAASLFERGAHGFRIGIAMSPEEMYGRAEYVSWSETDKALTVTLQFTRAQHLAIDTRMRMNIEASIIGKRAFSIIESQHRTDLEEAIVRAVYWYSDAHRDETAVMRFLKYWSCIEAFFSGDRDEITKSVSIGLAATLTHSSLNFCEPKEYLSLKRRIAHLYAPRSKAAHRAAYGHVSDRDVSDLSQWVSWLIVSAIAFVERGATTCTQVRDWAYRVDSQHGAAADSKLPPSFEEPPS